MEKACGYMVYVLVYGASYFRNVCDCILALTQSCLNRHRGELGSENKMNLYFGDG